MAATFLETFFCNDGIVSTLPNNETNFISIHEFPFLITFLSSNPILLAFQVLLKEALPVYQGQITHYGEQYKKWSKQGRHRKASGWCVDGYVY